MLPESDNVEKLAEQNPSTLPPPEYPKHENLQKMPFAAKAPVLELGQCVM